MFPPRLLVQEENYLEQVDEIRKRRSGERREAACISTYCYFFKTSGRRRSEQVGELTDGQSASLRQRTG